MPEFTNSFDQILESFEKNIIAQTLKDTHGNQTKAASMLGMTKRKIQYKIKKYQIDFKSFRYQEMFVNRFHDPQMLR